MTDIYKKINEEIKKAERLILVVHQNPDGDALGSATALKEYLKELGKKSVIWSATPVLSKYMFLTHANSVESSKKIFNDDEIDRVIVLDSGDLKYAGVDKLINGLEHKIINIDHHPTNQKYGLLNLVEPLASSTCEIMYDFFTINKIKINNRMATSLLTGIITDTDSFSNAATSTSAFLASSELVRLGGNINKINKAVVKNKTVNSLKLWGAAFSRLKKIEELNLIYTWITREDLKKYNVPESESEGVANFLNNIDGSGITLLLKETDDGQIKGSFRTTRNDKDVSAWAKTFGGGGHKKAAGFTTKGTINEILKKILTLK